MPYQYYRKSLYSLRIIEGHKFITVLYYCVPPSRNKYLSIVDYSIFIITPQFNMMNIAYDW
jgi:hypothetical protein